MADRLSSVSPELAAALRDAPNASAHQTALAYANMALQLSRLSDRWLSAMLSKLGSGARPSPSDLERLTILVESLDEAAWEIDERADGAGGETYVQAFSDARAAAAILLAVSSDAREEVLEVAYEAWAAGVPLADLLALRSG